MSVNAITPFIELMEDVWLVVRMDIMMAVNALV